MIGIIKRPNINIAKPINPDDYFDPTTHTATEENFIKFLEAGGKYDDKSLVGYKVQLSNSAAYNGGTYVIADVNHDSANTGQSNCYDLISEDCFHSTTFGSSQYWRNSTVRTWLNDTFYNGFSTDFKSHMNNITYDSNGSTYNDDKVILPSYTEVYSSVFPFAIIEGTTYPIFTDNNSRRKYQTGTTTYVSWWTRSRHTGNSYILLVYTDGSMAGGSYDYTPGCLAPILRVS